MFYAPRKLCCADHCKDSSNAFKIDQRMQSCSALRDASTTIIVVSGTVAQSQLQVHPFAWLCLQC
jgi:hypothetical protein